MNRKALFHMKPIIPPRGSKIDVNKELEKEAKKFARDVERAFNAEMKWKKPLKFTKDVVDDRHGVTVSVYTDNKVFKYLDEGTKAHFIKPKNKKALHWPGKRGSGKGAGRGRPRTPKEGFFSKGHQVSGIKARNYIDIVYKTWANKYVQRMYAVFDRATKGI